LEARRAESGDGVIGEGQPAPSPPAREVWGSAVSSAVSSPSGVRGGCPAATKGFPAF